LKFFFCTDVHASEFCFKKLMHVPEAYKVDKIIIGGDLTGKAVIPVVEHKDGKYTASLVGNILRAESKEELADIERKVSGIGYYPAVLSESENEELQSHHEKVEEMYWKLGQARLENWLVTMEEKLKPKGIQVWMTGGNDDPFEIEAMLKKSNFVIDCESIHLDLDEGFEMISSGYANQTPWKCPRDIPDDQLYNKLEYELVPTVKNMRKCIFNIHPPPYDTHLDLVWELDWDTQKPKMRDGQIRKVPVGSMAVRSVIQDHQPLCSLHGHIHEGKGMHEIGKTHCFNPGSEYNSGILMGLIVYLENEKVEDFLFTSG
jgi:Icc-related predicted phosphoesterase